MRVVTLLLHRLYRKAPEMRFSPRGWAASLSKKLRRLFLAPLRSDVGSQRSKFRRLLVEQFEDRRVLATAVDDSFAVHANTTLTVNGIGTWSNDSYNMAGGFHFQMRQLAARD